MVTYNRVKERYRAILVPTLIKGIDADFSQSVPKESLWERLLRIFRGRVYRQHFGPVTMRSYSQQCEGEFAIIGKNRVYTATVNKKNAILDESRLVRRTEFLRTCLAISSRSISLSPDMILPASGINRSRSQRRRLSIGLEIDPRIDSPRPAFQFLPLKDYRFSP